MDLDSIRACGRELCEALVLCDDVALLGEIGGFANDIITAIINFLDERRTLLISDDAHMVAHSHRVGAANTTQAKITFYFALHHLSLFGEYGIPAACISDDSAFHRN